MTFIFFLGGHDLEMKVIRNLLEQECGASAFLDKQLSWGAKLSDYATEIEKAYAEGYLPVAVELTDDMPLDWPPRKKLRLLDHHDDRHSNPSSLRQVFELLQLPEVRWTRDYNLVAANDVGHVRAMKETGATQNELIDIRRRDRAAQGISTLEEAAGLDALRNSENINDSFLIVQLAHGRTATVMDPLILEPEFESWPKNTVVLSPAMPMVFGPRSLIERLVAEFPTAFSGGDNISGFFGLPGGNPKNVGNILESVKRHLILPFAQN